MSVGAERPLPSAAVGPEDHRRVAELLRDVRWNAQRYLAPGAGLDEVVRSKQEWIERRPSALVDTRAPAEG